MSMNDDELTPEELALLKGGEDVLEDGEPDDDDGDAEDDAPVAEPDDAADESEPTPEDDEGDDLGATMTLQRIAPEKAKPVDTRSPAEIALSSELAAARRERAELREKLAAFENPPKEEEQFVPADPLTDPEGFARQQQEWRDSVTQSQQATVQQQQQAAFVQAVQSDVQRARSESPDYDAAYDFAIQSRKTELRTMYPAATDDEIMGVIGQDEVKLAQIAMQNGKRPSEQLKEWATSRGWSPQKEAPKPRAAKDRNRSLGSVAGGKAGMGVSAEQAASMDDEEFDALPAAVKAKLMGAP